MTEDEEGDELPSVELARLKALTAAREIMGAAIRFGLDPEIDAIVVVDEGGKVVLTVPLSDAIPKRWRS